MFRGLKILDFTNNLAGPYTGALFADYGAEVIHIEKPVYGDDCRFYAPALENESVTHSIVNRGKKSVVINLKDAEGIEIIKKMVSDADVLIESSRPGVMDKLGLGYDVLEEINPRLIYCSISAFGQTGPYAKRPGYDIIAQAYSGLLNNTGEPDGEPMVVGTEVGDYVGALTSYGAICAALYSREKTGKGQHLDISLARALMWMTVSFEYEYTGEKLTRHGNHNTGLCPYGVFNGNDGSIIIATLSMKLWKALCEVMGKPELIEDPDYVTNDKRVENKKKVIEIIEGWLKGFDSVDEALVLLMNAGIPSSKVFTPEDINADPHANEAGWIKRLLIANGKKREHKIESFRACPNPSVYSVFEPKMEAAPILGENNYEVLSRYGYSKEKISELESKWEKL